MSISILPEQAKIAELRAKTDRQLITLIEHQLDAGLRLSDGLSALAAARAEALYTESSRLLPKVYNLAERLRLEKKLAALRDALDGDVRPLARVAGA